MEVNAVLLLDGGFEDVSLDEVVDGALLEASALSD